MPIINVTLIEGRTQEQKEKLVAAMANAVHESIGAPLDSVRIIINEVPKCHFSVGGKFKE